MSDDRASGMTSQATTSVPLGTVLERHADDDTVLVDWPDARSRTQSADVLLRRVPAYETGRTWTAAALVDHPGCVVTVAHDGPGTWSLYRTRGGQATLVLPQAGALDDHVIRGLALVVHRHIVLLGPTGLVSAIETACPAIRVSARIVEGARTTPVQGG